jgi:hypothetical protein
MTAHRSRDRVGGRRSQLPPMGGYTYEYWLQQHIRQLQQIALPAEKWPTLFSKLVVSKVPPPRHLMNRSLIRSMDMEGGGLRCRCLLCL